MSIRGRFVWEELMTTDVASAASFYGKVAGLKTEKAPFDPNYTTFKGTGGNMGGVMALPAEAKQHGTPPMWMSYIGVPNTDETARMITTLGGKVHKAPWTIGDGGRIAIVADPQGATFALYSNAKATDAPPQPKVGHASWHELITTDYAAAFSFYQNVFGWRVINDMDMGGQGIYRLFGAEGSSDSDMLGGMYTKAPNQPGPPAWLPYIKVTNIVSATEAAKKSGATIMHGPADVPGGKITMGKDPQGAVFAIHQVIPPAAPKKASPKASPKPRSKAKAKAGAAKKKKVAPKKKSAAKKKVMRKLKAGSKK
jgi:predicted enzyme related to lactoylglutathione lyase